MTTDFSKMRVVDLKAELKKRGLPQSGLKQELIERLRQADAQVTATPTQPSSPAAAKAGNTAKLSAKKHVSASVEESLPAPVVHAPTAEPASVERPPLGESPAEPPLGQPSSEIESSPANVQAPAEPPPVEGVPAEPEPEPEPTTEAVRSVEPTASHGSGSGPAGLPPSLSSILNHDDNSGASAGQAATLEAVGGPAPSSSPRVPVPDPSSSGAPLNVPEQGASSPHADEVVSDVRKRKRRSRSPSPSAEEVAQKRARVSDEAIQRDSGGDVQPSDAVEAMQVDVPDTEQHDGTAVQAISELNHDTMEVEDSQMDDAGAGSAPRPSRVPVEEVIQGSEQMGSPAAQTPTEESRVEQQQRSDSAEQAPAEGPTVEQQQEVTGSAELARSAVSQRSPSPSGEQVPAREPEVEQQQQVTDSTDLAQPPISPRRSPSPRRERVSGSKDARFKGLFGGGASKDRDAQEIVEPMDDTNDRDVEPALHPATSGLYIRELMRPLHAPTLRAHLTALAGRPGSASDPDVITEFYLDSIRTHCLVAFANVAAASRVRSALHQVVWPEERSRKALWVDFVPEAKIREWIETEQSAAGGAGSRGGNQRWEVVYEDDGRADGEGPGVRAVLREVGAHGPRGGGGRGQGAKGAPLGPRGRDHESRPAASSQQPPQGRRAPASKSTGSGFMALDSLFSSTAAKPKLYYLPVAKGLAEKRLNQFVKLSSRRGGGGAARRGGHRGNDELHRYTFEDGDLLVDQGPELGDRYRGNGLPGPPPPPPPRAGDNSWHRNEGRPRPPPYRRDRW